MSYFLADVFAINSSVFSSMPTNIWRHDPETVSQENHGGPLVINPLHAGSSTSFRVNIVTCWKTKTQGCAGGPAKILLFPWGSYLNSDFR